MEDDPSLLAWLDAFASEKIREGKGWNLKKDMIRLGNEIYNETFKSLTDELYAKLYHTPPAKRLMTMALLSDMRGPFVREWFRRNLASGARATLSVKIPAGVDEGDEHGAAREPLREGGSDWRYPDIGHHLDRQRGAQHGAGVGTSHVVRQQPERDGGHPRPQ